MLSTAVQNANCEKKIFNYKKVEETKKNLKKVDYWDLHVPAAVPARAAAFKAKIIHGLNYF